MKKIKIPIIFKELLAENCIKEADVINTTDGFFMIYKSLSDILYEKNILDFIDSENNRLACSNFFDDWFLYSVMGEDECTYSLLKFREQEYDAEKGILADGDTPGVTISFISFECEILLACLRNPVDENKKKLNREINRVVAYRGQRHHKALKRYFINTKSKGSYLVAFLYAKLMASFAENGQLEVPKHYKEIVQRSVLCKKNPMVMRLPDYITSLNQEAGRLICDNEKIFIRNQEQPDKYECAAILATHTGNTSVYSFAAEVEYHARFLLPILNIKILFMGKTIYESAIRADMTIGDADMQGLAPFYNENNNSVKKHYKCHQETYKKLHKIKGVYSK